MDSILAGSLPSPDRNSFPLPEIMQYLALAGRFDYSANKDESNNKTYPCVFATDSRLYKLSEETRRAAMTALNAAALQIKAAKPDPEIAKDCDLPWLKVQALLVKTYQNLAHAFHATLPA